MPIYMEIRYENKTLYIRWCHFRIVRYRDKSRSECKLESLIVGYIKEYDRQKEENSNHKEQDRRASFARLKLTATCNFNFNNKKFQGNDTRLYAQFRLVRYFAKKKRLTHRTNVSFCFAKSMRGGLEFGKNSNPITDE